MSIDQIIEETTIKLPKPLSLEETEKLMEYLAKQLPGDVNYNISANKSIIHGAEDEGLLKFDGTVGVKANIKSHSSGAYEHFSCEPDEFARDTSRISVIKFMTVPGWELFEYRKEVVGLWREVRNLVTQYFNQI